MKHHISQTAIATLLAATPATAQEVDPRIQAMVSELHAEGYTEFTLNDSIFTPPTLVAEQAAILLRLRLDPDTLAPTAATIALDTDGDGILSARERRRRIELVYASGQAIVALSAINEVTNRIEQHRGWNTSSHPSMLAPLTNRVEQHMQDAVTDAVTDAARDTARDTARDAISDRVSDRR